MTSLFPFIATSICTIAIDMLWIGFIARNTLVNLIKPYLTLDAAGELIVRAPYAVACWLLVVTGTYIFVTQSLPESASLQDHALKGALFGAVTYGVYDLTNAALQIQWPVTMIVLDVGWGMVLCAICAMLWKLLL